MNNLAKMSKEFKLILTDSRLIKVKLSIFWGDNLLPMHYPNFLLPYIIKIILIRLIHVIKNFSALIIYNPLISLILL